MEVYVDIGWTVSVLASSALGVLESLLFDDLARVENKNERVS